MSEKNKGYSDTLNLPHTSFSMKANLIQREPQIRKQWEKEDLYGQIRKQRKDAPLYVLHDGPPYANGDIHMGHVINKVLKDMVIKYKTMTGFNAPFVPGWDCHGLPIEAKVMNDLGEKARAMSKLDIRRDCFKYASKYIKLQGRQFQDLGILGDFSEPYLTFKPAYEAGILEVFAELVDKGLVYKQLKPIHWSVGCETALAEAELEYKDIDSPSIYVNFPILLEEDVKKLRVLKLINDPQETMAYLMIWTTTPWTLAANLAVAVHPDLDYVVLTYQRNGRIWHSIVCSERVEAVVKAAGLKEGQFEVSGNHVKGGDLEGFRYIHPFVGENPTDKDAYKVILAQYVTTEDGTGLVHIAPGHGMEDYTSGQQYDLAVYSPVKDDGCYDDTVPDWLRGKSVLKVDREIIDHLKQNNDLVAEHKITHSYPHCWRSKGPVIFRATEQWFISVDKKIPGPDKSLRELALAGIHDVTWIPAWGQKRIEGMLELRPDWCISRQRSWGLPIPVFVMPDGRSLMTRASVLAVARYIAEHGSNTWFQQSPREILGPDFVLPEGFDVDQLQKEENIFDVWFESGCSWYSVCVKRAHWEIPIDLYLEGSDQHRGWFQLSLLPALGATGKPPYKSVLTHGFTVDDKGMKQSKSLGNYVNAQEEVNKYGADILRLWVASVNYQEDVRCSDDIIGKTQDVYRKIRNTLRFMFGNINDYDPHRDAVPYNLLMPIDQWALQQLQKLIAGVRDAYEGFMFHRVFSSIYQFCTVEMSSIYMDVLKDRMYCEAPSSHPRRSAQTVVYRILDALIRMLAPILAHTAEEAWAAMDHKSQDVESVHLTSMPHVDPAVDVQAQEALWNRLMTLRDNILRVLEGLRRDKEINSNQEASVHLRCTDEDAAVIEHIGMEHFAALCIVSEIILEKGAPATSVTASKCKHLKCQRCWNYLPTVGTHEGYPDLCQRCKEVVQQAGR